MEPEKGTSRCADGVNDTLRNSCISINDEGCLPRGKGLGQTRGLRRRENPKSKQGYYS